MLFYACNVPFSHVKSEHFKRLVSKPRPGYNSLTRKAVAGNILGDIQNELQNHMIRNLKGWNNVHNYHLPQQPCINEGRLYLVDAGKDPKTVAYMIDL